MLYGFIKRSDNKVMIKHFYYIYMAFLIAMLFPDDITEFRMMMSWNSKIPPKLQLCLLNHEKPFMKK